MKNLIKKSENLPVGAIATALAIATLSNAYLIIGGYAGLRHISMLIATIVWCAAIIKIIVHFQTFKKDYLLVVPGSLYATFSMLTMVLGSYFFQFNEVFGRTIWLVGIALHMIHIIIFTWLNVIKGINSETFIPSWFVTYLGILVSTVVALPVGIPNLLNTILYYGLIAFSILLPLMIYRLVKKPLQEQFKPTIAIFLAPSSLCLIGYLNLSTNPSAIIVYSLYTIIFIKLLYVYCRIPLLIKNKFNPGFAAFTFPLAISTIASISMSNYLISLDMPIWGMLVYQLSGLQLYLATAVIVYVSYNFLRLYLPSLASN